MNESCPKILGQLCLKLHEEMKVEVSAIGELKKYIPEEILVELTKRPITLKQIALDNFGIPRTISGMCFVVNGRVQQSNYQPKDKDKILVLKMGGGG